MKPDRTPADAVARGVATHPEWLRAFGLAVAGILLSAGAAAALILWRLA